MASVKTQGCTLGLGDAASPEVYTSVINLVSFQGPSGSRQVIDSTTLASVAKEKDVGIPDLGQITYDYNFSASDPALIDCWDNFNAGTLHNFRIAFSDSPATQFDFAAYVLNFSFSAGLDDIVRGSVTLEISGPVTDNLA